MCLSSLASKLQKLQQATESRNPITAKTQFISNSGKKKPGKKTKKTGIQTHSQTLFSY
jgi:hypothetical protein